MATGDFSDIVGRLKAVLPRGWFPATAPGAASATPVLDTVLSGFAAAWSAIYAQISYTRLQTRIATATDVFLDLIAQDFFQGRIVRRAGQGDASFRARIKVEVLRPRVTRQALIQALTDLTGTAPIVFEPSWPPDTGGIGDGRAVLASQFYSSAVGGAGWGAFGGIGITLNAATAPDGSNTASELVLPSNGGAGTYAGAVACVAGQPVMVGVWLRAVAGTMTARLVLGGGFGPTFLPCALTTAWQFFSIEIVAPITATAEIQVDNGAGSGSLYAWGAQIVVASAVGRGLAFGNASGSVAGAGGWGSLALPYQFFVTAYPAGGGGIGGVMGLYNGSGPAFGGYGAGAIEIGSFAMSQGQITTDDINAAIASVLPVATIAWARIAS